jgi:hypothetical protein
MMHINCELLLVFAKINKTLRKLPKEPCSFLKLEINKKNILKNTYGKD